MGAAAHLGISLREYDARIRTFIPNYTAMLDAAAQALASASSRAPVIVDLGIGTGALSSRCLRVRPSARVIGIDEDAAMLGVAARRLGERLSPVHADFGSAPLPPANAIVASFALHHVRTIARKRRLYVRCARALAKGGVLISADAFRSADLRQQKEERRVWQRHLARRYGNAGADKYLRTWSREDTYMPLDDEVRALRDAGFVVDLPWRAAPFAVVVATKLR